MGDVCVIIGAKVIKKNKTSPQPSPKERGKDPSNSPREGRVFINNKQ
jgi:hypothetical protein